MRFFFLYIALAALGVNIASNMAAGTAEALEQRQQARYEKLCEINPVYCP